MIRAGQRLSESMGDAPPIGRSCVELMLTHNRTGELTAMVEQAVAGIALTTRFGQGNTTAFVLAVHAATRLVDMGRFADAADHLEPVVADARGNVRMAG
jgi:hypothetical protein